MISYIPPQYKQIAYDLCSGPNLRNWSGTVYDVINNQITLKVHCHLGKVTKLEIVRTH